ncbi:hypothetical protein DFH28DRAFT_922814 [Melampsora americana]|nr:hypothetical protein DFH28DRAFT_922814 [Melampsora americana]
MPPSCPIILSRFALAEHWPSFPQPTLQPFSLHNAQSPIINAGEVHLRWRISLALSIPILPLIDFHRVHPPLSPMSRRVRYTLASKTTPAPTNGLSTPTPNVTPQPTSAPTNKRLRSLPDPIVPTKRALRSNTRLSEPSQGGSNENRTDVNQCDIKQALHRFNRSHDQEMGNEEDNSNSEKSCDDSDEDRHDTPAFDSPPRGSAPEHQTPNQPAVSDVRHRQIPTHLTGSMLRSFNSLAGRGELNEDHLVIGRRLCPAIEREDQFMAMIVSVLAARQETVSLVNELTLKINDLKDILLTRESSGARGRLPWEETSELRQCVRLLASQIILRGDLQAYTTTQDRDGDQDILPYSLYAQVMKGMLANPTEWRNRLLPARYGRDPDPRCAKALRKMIKNILKEVRKEFESLLLTHIQLPNRVNTLSHANVPLLETVIVKLYQKERGLIGGRVRRMQVLHWGLNRELYENKSFWAVVDQNLERLRRETTRFRYAYFILVLQDDFDRIDGTKTFEQLKTSCDFALPTKERVQQTMGTLLETFGTDVQDDKAAHELPEDVRNGFQTAKLVCGKGAELRFKTGQEPSRDREKKPRFLPRGAQGVLKTLVTCKKRAVVQPHVPSSTPTKAVKTTKSKTTPKANADLEVKRTSIDQEVPASEDKELGSEAEDIEEPTPSPPTRRVVKKPANPKAKKLKGNKE